MKTVDLGVMDFDQALQIQKRALDEVIQGGTPVLFLVEHTPVITIGRHADSSHVLGTRDRAGSTVPVHRTERGGDVTCHFPGQLVAYPIFRVGRRRGGLKQFFHDLEEVVIQVLAAFQIRGHRQPGLSGVFVQNRKIASIGIGVRKWVSFHGLALNVTRELDLFQSIIPCGLHSVAMTSIHLERGDSYPDMSTLKERMIHAFTTTFANS